MTHAWHESPSECVDRLTEERDNAYALWRVARARLHESRRNWERLIWAVRVLAAANFCALLALALGGM